jgi:hypothetical protein
MEPTIEEARELTLAPLVAPRVFKSVAQVKGVNTLLSKKDENYVRLEVQHIAFHVEGLNIPQSEIQFKIARNPNILRMKPSAALNDKAVIRNVIVIEFEECIKDVTSYIKDDATLIHEESFFMVRNIAQALDAELYTYCKNVVSDDLLAIYSRDMNKAVDIINIRKQ